MDKKRILVADDEENTLHAVEFVLETADYRVATAKNGREALEKVVAARDSRKPFDLFIVDIQMPGLTGLELMDELKRLNIDVPILVITGYGSEELAAELVRRGCDGYLDKPFDDEKLVKRVATIFEKRSRQ
jgi:CheY-like chemotaxis protein